MLQEDKTNWDSFFTAHPNAYGFEGSSITADGWALYGGSTQGYVTNVKLMGSKSSLSHNQGAVTWPNNHNNGFYFTAAGWNNSSQAALYARAYMRWSVANGIWPDLDYKVWGIYGPPFGANFNIMMNIGGPPIGVGILPSGEVWSLGVFPWTPSVLPENEWVLFEVKFPNHAAGAPYNYQVWVNNELVINANREHGVTFGTYANSTFDSDINHFNTPSGYNKDQWTDGFALSSSRIGPASLIEIGNAPNYATATKVYQAPEKLSETSSQIKANLTGLGAGPYYLWVTNNRGERSQPYSLTTSTTPLPPPANLRTQ